MTLLELLTDAYRIAGIISETDTPSAEQGAMGVTRFNDMMAALEADGIDLGHSPKSATTDTVALPDGYVGGIKDLLAVKLFTQYMGQTVPAQLAVSAQGAFERMLRQAVMLQNTRVNMAHMSPGAANPYMWDFDSGR